MLTTYVKPDAARKLRQGVPWVKRDEIARMEGEPRLGEPVQLRDESGELLGFADVDLDSPLALRRLGLPQESPEGIIQRHLRRALERRGQLIDDPRYCRLVNDDGDGLPGLVVDRYDSHYGIQTLSRAMDARHEEIARSLMEVMGAASVTLRNDTPRRALVGLPRQRSKVLSGTPPRWTRVLDRGARFTVDLAMGRGTGFNYEKREVRQLVGRLAHDALVIDPACSIGGLFVHAGLQGARQILAFEQDPDTLELARENAEANGLFGRASVELADPVTALQGVSNPADLVLLNLPEHGANGMKPFLELLRLAMRATRHGGRLLVVGYQPPFTRVALDGAIAQVAELEGRMAIRVARAGLPADFPTLIGSPGSEHLFAVAVELS